MLTNEPALTHVVMSIEDMAELLLLHYKLTNQLKIYTHIAAATASLTEEEIHKDAAYLTELGELIDQTSTAYAENYDRFTLEERGQMYKYIRRKLGVSIPSGQTMEQLLRGGSM